MAIQKDHTGKRWVEVSREVAGTQEEVWDAIATGPGISSWFVPTDVECDRSGKPVRVVSHFGDDPNGAWTPCREVPASFGCATSW